jgi:hypothetical protein
MFRKQEEDRAKELENRLSPSSHNLLSNDDEDDALGVASPVSVIDPSISNSSMFSFNETKPNLNRFGTSLKPVESKCRAPRGTNKLETFLEVL